MEQRISLVTLAVRDLAATRHFYVDGLGWSPSMDVEGEVIMFPVGERLLLSLWDEAAFEAEVGPIARADGVPPVTLAHNVTTPEEVDAILETARRAGAEVQAAQVRAWGGYSGYFADPDGFRWEIAGNPDTDGPSVLPVV